MAEIGPSEKWVGDPPIWVPGEKHHIYTQFGPGQSIPAIRFGWLDRFRWENFQKTFSNLKLKNCDFGGSTPPPLWYAWRRKCHISTDLVELYTSMGRTPRNSSWTRCGDLCKSEKRLRKQQFHFQQAKVLVLCPMGTICFWTRKAVFLHDLGPWSPSTCVPGMAQHVACQWVGWSIYILGLLNETNNSPSWKPLCWGFRCGGVGVLLEKVTKVC